MEYADTTRGAATPLEFRPAPSRNESKEERRKAQNDGVKLWSLILFAGLGLTSITYGFQRDDVFDIALGVVVLVGGSLGYIAWNRRL
jgi:hypothetical protein